MVMNFGLGAPPASQVVQTGDEMQKAFYAQMAAANAQNSIGQEDYNKAIGAAFMAQDAGLGPEQRYANAAGIINGALGDRAGQFTPIMPNNGMPGIPSGLNPSFLQGMAQQYGGAAWGDLNNWAPVDTKPMQDAFNQKMGAFNQNSTLQNQAYDRMQGGGFNGGVLSGGATTSMFGTPMAGGLGGLGGYNPSGGFGQPGSQQSMGSYGSNWSGGFGQPEGGGNGLGGPFGVKNPWSNS